jgi:phosphate transport system protein
MDTKEPVRHFEEELDQLKARLLAMGGLAEERVRVSVEALVKRDPDKLATILDGDEPINQFHVEIDQRAFTLLALHQPMASSLRVIVAALKINSDLERIGDLAVNIAHKAGWLSVMPPLEMPFDLAQMGLDTQQMLADSLDSLVNADVRLAHEVCVRDAGIDAMKRQIRRAAIKRVREEPECVETVLTLLAAVRNLERIADHATNIAEDVIYMTEGRIVRHNRAPQASEAAERAGLAQQAESPARDTTLTTASPRRRPS